MFQLMASWSLQDMILMIQGHGKTEDSGGRIHEGRGLREDFNQGAKAECGARLTSKTMLLATHFVKLGFTCASLGTSQSTPSSGDKVFKSAL